MTDDETIARLHATIARLLEENERLREAIRKMHAVLRPRVLRE
jgi:hypothetical protein